MSNFDAGGFLRLLLWGERAVLAGTGGTLAVARRDAPTKALRFLLLGTIVSGAAAVLARAALSPSPSAP